MQIKNLSIVLAFIACAMTTMAAPMPNANDVDVLSADESNDLVLPVDELNDAPVEVAATVAPEEPELGSDVEAEDEPSSAADEGEEDNNDEEGEEENNNEEGEEENNDEEGEEDDNNNTGVEDNNDEGDAAEEPSVPAADDDENNGSEQEADEADEPSAPAADDDEKW